MVITLTALSDLATLGFDMIIDARAPAEWVEDHLPGAVSLPVLDDAERARIGTIYHQESPFRARKIGGALVARNVAAHLEGPLADLPGSWRPLIYCWRGGQRSGAFAAILAQIGWRAETLAGGYKSYRKLVVAALYDQPVASPVWVLDGNTGTAKTALLARLAARGMQVLDLEGLANHRGSIFGGRGLQPSQKAFEGRLAAALAGLDPARPVVVEAESSKVGDRSLPPKLWAAMSIAPRLRIEAPLAARARYLVRAYADVTADRAALDALLNRLKPLYAAEVIETWLGQSADADHLGLAADLMQRHYDPRYARSRARRAGALDQEFHSDTLEPEALDALADRLRAAFQG